MKKILALTVAGTLLVTSSVCVFAAEDTTGENTVTEANSDVDPSPDIKGLQDKIKKQEEQAQADREKAEKDKAELNQKIGELKSVQEELSKKLTTLANDNKELEQKKAQLTKQLESTNKSLDAAVKAKNKYEEKYNNATAAPKRRLLQESRCLAKITQSVTETADTSLRADMFRSTAERAMLHLHFQLPQPVF